MFNAPYRSDERPPFVRFEEREYGVDQAESEKAGRPIPKLVHFALITSFGSKDTLEKVAEEWLAQIREKAIRGQFNPEWVSRFKMMYDEYLKGNELPREGTPVQTWSQLTKEQARRLKSIGLTTVEDLALQPDSALGQIGLDGRYIRDLAKAWIGEAKDKGIIARELADANVKLEAQADRIGTLEAQIAELSAMVKASGKSRAA